MNTQLLLQARVLDIDEQIERVEAIWDGIDRTGLFCLHDRKMVQRFTAP